MPPRWRPFVREADIVRNCLATGLAALRKANHMEHGLYNEAFFNLSIGFERLLKLIVLIDFGLTNGGTFPDTKRFRHDFGHDIEKLFAEAQKIRARRVDDGGDFEWNLVDEEVTKRILRVLSEFATQTRYFNLNDLTANGASISQRDPIEAWATEVGDLVAQSYSPRQRAEDTAFAAFADAMLGDRSITLQETEGGRAIRDLEDSVQHSRRMAFVQREATFHCVMIVRYLTCILGVLNDSGRKGSVVELPHFGEFFYLYNNSDSYLRGRKTFLK